VTDAGGAEEAQVVHGLSSGEQTEGDRGEALVLRAVLELLSWATSRS
jgi:hypothetical protein